MTWELKRIPLLPLVKVSFVVFFALSLIGMLLYALFLGSIIGMVGGMVGEQFDMAPFTGGALLIFGLMGALFGSVMYTLMTLIAGLIYNAVASLVGGVELELEAREFSADERAYMPRPPQYPGSQQPGYPPPLGQPGVMPGQAAPHQPMATPPGPQPPAAAPAVSQPGVEPGATPRQTAQPPETPVERTSQSPAVEPGTSAQAPERPSAEAPQPEAGETGEEREDYLSRYRPKEETSEEERGEWGWDPRRQETEARKTGKPAAEGKEPEKKPAPEPPKDPGSEDGEDKKE